MKGRQKQVMSENRKYSKNFISYTDYVEGNAVRKVEERPGRQPRTYVNNKRINTSTEIYRNREKALRMSAGYVAVLAVCSVLMAGVCASYLSLRDDITSKKASIASLEIQCEALEAQNDSLDYSINSYIDIDNITKVATEELGMVQAGKDQITFYDSTEMEYMKQYEEIPQK